MMRGPLGGAVDRVPADEQSYRRVVIAQLPDVPTGELVAYGPVFIEPTTHELCELIEARGGEVVAVAPVVRASDLLRTQPAGGEPR